jgi:hypothetical protein
MSEPTRVHCYGYVDRPYEAVRVALHERPLELLRAATTVASARAGSMAAHLRLALGGAEIGVGIRPEIRSVREDEAVAGLGPVTRVDLGWRAFQGAAFFPVMSAQLSAWAVGPQETQISLEGSYEPPLGALGGVIDAAIGRHVAEGCVHALLRDLSAQLHREIAPPL